MQDMVCVVTGANSGIGRETARELARRGATVVMTARDRERGEAALLDVRETTGSERVELVMLDLADLGSVRAAAAEILERWDRLDVLINNAGLILSERRETAQGFEATFGINHLGPFLLTTLLLDRLQDGGGGRVVNLASEGHRMSKGLAWDDLMAERRPYGGIAAYGDSKLANILFTVELARGLEGTGVTAYAVHPGVVRSGFAGDGDDRGWFGWFVKLTRFAYLSPARGARTSLYCATDALAGVESGHYYKGCKRSRASARGRDAEAAKRLWTVSEALVAESSP